MQGPWAFRNSIEIDKEGDKGHKEGDKGHASTTIPYGFMKKETKNKMEESTCKNSVNVGCPLSSSLTVQFI